MKQEKLQKPVAYVPVRLPQSMVDAMRQYHEDNLSRGIRQAIKHYLSTREKNNGN